MKTIREQLFALQDSGYKEFQSRLMPTVDPNTVIGVRVPLLRKMAKEFAKTPEAEIFLGQLPHRYYEENCIHGFLIEEMKDFDFCVAALDEFLPYVNNWATCDMMSPKALKQKTAQWLPVVRRWMHSDQTYVIRFGILTLMRLGLEDAFMPEFLEIVSVIRKNEYYVNMMIAWFFAEALVKQYDAALPYLEQNLLDPWTHNKTIQKARESYRIAPDRKAYLATLKRLP